MKFQLKIKNSSNQLVHIFNNILDEVEPQDYSSTIEYIDNGLFSNSSQTLFKEYRQYSLKLTDKFTGLKLIGYKKHNVHIRFIKNNLDLIVEYCGDYLNDFKKLFALFTQGIKIQLNTIELLTLFGRNQTK